MALKVLLGNLEFKDNKKQFIEVTPFLENSNIQISETSNNELPTISNLNFTFLEDENLMSEIDGLYDFVNDNKDYSLFPLLVFLDNELIFNGYIEKTVLNIQSGTNFNDTYIKNYSYQLIHKAKELSMKYISRIISYQSVTSKKYFNYLFETNPRITKYNKSDNDLIYTEGVRLQDLILNKKYLYKYKTLKVGDVVHRIYNANTLTSINYDFIDSIYFLDYVQNTEVLINVYNNIVTLYDFNENVLAQGIIQDDIFCNFTEINGSGFNGTVIFKSGIDFNNYEWFWENESYWSWGNEANWAWGLDGFTFYINTNEIQNAEVKKSHVINKVKDFADFSFSRIVDNIYTDNLQIRKRFIINIHENNLYIYDYDTRELIAQGVINNYSCDFVSVGTSGINGTIIFNSGLDNYGNTLFKWEDDVSFKWEDDVEWYWELEGSSFLLDTTQISLEFFEDIIIPSGTTKIKTKIGYDVEVLDESANVEITNPIIKFDTATSLIDALSDDYLFNYKFDNFGNIKLYTNTLEDLTDEKHILQIGNNPEDVLDYSNIYTNNCTINNGIVTQTNIGEFYIDYSTKNLIANKRYKLHLDSNVENIEIYCNNKTLSVNFEEKEQKEGSDFIFTTPINYTDIVIRLRETNNTYFNIYDISLTEALYTEEELNVIYKLNNINFDATGLSTALHITNFSQIEKTESIEQINVYAPAENTYHQIKEISLYNPSETISTGSEEITYYKLGQGIDYLGFPIILDKSTFIKTINIDTYRNTLSSDMCIFATFIKNNTETVFNQIIPSENIQSNTLTLNPIFLYKHEDDVFNCKIEKKYYEKEIITYSNGEYSFSTINYTRYNANDYIYISNNTGGLSKCKVISSSSTKVVFIIESGDSISNGENAYIVANTDNSINSNEYLEFEATNIFANGEDFLDIGGTININKTLIKEILIQNSWVARYPVINIGDNYTGSPNMALIREENTSTDTFYIVDSDNNLVDFDTNFEYYFKFLLTYDLVYLEIFNSIENEWQVVRLKSYDPTNKTITLWDNINISEYGINGLVQFRRVYITNNIDFGYKPTDDYTYEAYITNGRISYGFNIDIDKKAISGDYEGNMYLKGNIISAVYDIAYTFPRYAEESDSVSKYGYLENLYTEDIDDNETYVAVTQNQLNYNIEPITTISIDVYFQAFEQFVNKKLTEIQLIKLYHKLLPKGYGLFSVEKKQWKRIKSGRVIITLTLEKVVG